MVLLAETGKAGERAGPGDYPGVQSLQLALKATGRAVRIKPADGQKVTMQRVMS